MKKVLSLVLALVLVLGSFPAFAAEATGAEELKANGFIEGGEGGDLMVDNPLKRGELAALLAELNGKKAEAKAYDGTSELTDIADHWSKNYVNYAVSMGWITGYPDKTYKPEDVVTGQQLQNVLLKVLGYETAWDAVPATANALELTVPTGEMLRGAAFDTVWTAVNTNVNGEDKTLGVKLGKIDEVVVVTELIVADVMSTNLREMKVNFNVAVDKTTAIDKANYTLSKGTVEKVVLSEDKMMATLTVSGLANQDAVKVEVKKVMDEAKALTVVANENTITMFDATIPVADSVKLVGPKTFEITFSEPIKTVGTVTINNGAYGVMPLTSSETNVVTVELAASSLAEGDYTIKLDGGFKDYAGYPAMAKSFVLTYAKETVPPTVTLVSANQREVVIKFDEKVVLDTVKKDHFYHTFSGYKPLSVTSTDMKEFTLVFADGAVPADDRPLAEGTVNVVVVYKANGTTIADEWGNKMGADVTLTADIAADKTAPTVAKVAPVKNDQSAVAVYFSENVKALETSNFVVKDSDGKEVAVSSVSATAKQNDGTYKATLSFAKALSGVYSVEVKGVKDLALSPNTIVAITMSIDVSDVTAPVLSNNAAGVLAKAITGTSPTKTVIYVYYPEKMAITGVNSVLDKSNYAIGGQPLADTDSIEMFKDGNVVKITVGKGQVVVGSENLEIGKVADLQGNIVQAFVSKINIDEAKADVAIAKVEQVDHRTVKVTVNSLLQGPTVGGFMIYDGSTTGSFASITNVSVNSDKQTVITGIVKSAEQFKTTETASTITTITLANEVLKTDLGVKINTTNSSTVLDAWAPQYVDKAFTTETTTTGTVTSGSISTITLEFTERLTTKNHSFIGNDLVITDKDGKALVNGIDFTTATDGNTKVVVTFLKSYKTQVTVKSAESFTYLKDFAGNKAVPFTKAMDIKF